MSTPMTPAQAAQNSNRDQGGRYSTKTHAEADVALETAKPPYEGLTEAAYDQMERAERETFIAHLGGHMPLEKLSPDSDSDDLDEAIDDAMVSARVSMSWQQLHEVDLETIHDSARAALAQPQQSDADGVDRERIQAELDRTMAYSVASHLAYAERRGRSELSDRDAQRENSIALDRAMDAAMDTATTPEAGWDHLQESLAGHDSAYVDKDKLGLGEMGKHRRIRESRKRRKNLEAFREAGAVAGQRLDDDALAEAMPAGTAVTLTFASNPNHRSEVYIHPDGGQLRAVQPGSPDAGWTPAGQDTTYHRIEGTKDVLAVDRFGIPSTRFSPVR